MSITLNWDVPRKNAGELVGNAMNTIGQRIKVLREKRGMSQSELSRRIHVTPQAIQSLEADRNPNRRTKHVIGIAAALEIDPRYLDPQTTIEQFELGVANAEADRDSNLEAEPPAERDDDELIDAAIEQARRNINLQLKLSGATISGREYLKRLSDELRRLTTKQI